VRGSAHVHRTPAGERPRRPAPPRAPRPGRVPRRPRAVRPRAQMGGARPRLALRLPREGPRAVQRRGGVPARGGRARPAVPAGAGANSRRAALSHDGVRAVEGPHRRERLRGPPAVLRHLQARREERRRGARPGAGTDPDRRDGGDGGRRGHAPTHRADWSAGRPGACQLRARAPTGPARSVQRRCANAHRGGAEDRGAEPRSPHRPAPPAREARGGEGRPVAFAPARQRRRDHRVRPRPHHRAAPEAARDRLQAAEARRTGRLRSRFCLSPRLRSRLRSRLCSLLSSRPRPRPRARARFRLHFRARFRLHFRSRLRLRPLLSPRPRLSCRLRPRLSLGSRLVRRLPRLASAPSIEAQPPRPRAGLARGVGAGWRAVRVAAGVRRGLRVHPPDRARSRGRVRPRGGYDRRRVQAPLPAPSARLRPPAVRRRPDGPVPGPEGRGVLRADRVLSRRQRGRGPPPPSGRFTRGQSVL
jgi:hypothetical protein